MIAKKTCRVAGHLFSFSLDEGSEAWGSLGNYSPFFVDVTTGDEIFDLEVVEDLDITVFVDFVKSGSRGRDSRVSWHHLPCGLSPSVAG